MAFLGITSEPVMFLYAIAFMINYTVIPQLLLEKVCLSENHNNQTVCNGTSGMSIEMQKKASVWWFYLLTCSLLPSTFTVLIWGPLTDKIGRKKSLMFVALIDTMRSAIYLVNSFYITAHPAYLIFGSVLSCLHGELQGVITVCYAYIADATVEKENKRTVRMSLVEGSMYVSGIITGLISGYTLQIIGYVPVFMISLAVDILMLCYTCCLPVIPTSSGTVDETERILDDCSADEEDHKKSLKHIHQHMQVDRKKKSTFNPFKYVKNASDVITNPDIDQVVIPMLCAFGVTIIAVVGERVVQTLYLKNQPFYFSPKMIGYYTALQAGLRGIGVILVTQLLHRLFKCNDYIMIIIGLISQILVFILTGLSDSTLSVYLACIAGMCVPVPMAAMRSIITKSVPENKYGTILASVSAVDAFGSFVTNTVSLWVYDLTLTVYSGTVYFGICTFSLISLAIVVTTYFKRIIEIPRSGYQTI